MRVGEAELTPVVELEAGLVPVAALCYGWDPAQVEDQTEWLYPRHVDPVTGMARLSHQSWVLRTGGLTMLVDPCIGNSKPRPLPPNEYYNMLDTGAVERLVLCNKRLHIPYQCATVGCTLINEAERAMADFRIERDVVIEAPVDVVWRTITEPNQITRWFADRVEIELKPGGQGYLGFGEQSEQKGTTIVVETVDEPSRFAFRWNRPQDAHPEPANSVLVEFTLNAQGPERTHLRVVEIGLETVTWPDDEKQSYVEDHNGGWEQCFDRLAVLFAG